MYSVQIIKKPEIKILDTFLTRLIFNVDYSSMKTSLSFA